MTQSTITAPFQVRPACRPILCHQQTVILVSKTRVSFTFTAYHSLYPPGAHTVPWPLANLIYNHKITFQIISCPFIYITYYIFWIFDCFCYQHYVIGMFRVMHVSMLNTMYSVTKAVLSTVSCRCIYLELHFNLNHPATTDPAPHLHWL